MNLDKADITDISSALDTSYISAQELIEVQISKIKKRQCELNCYIELDISGAREAAKLSDQRRQDKATLSVLDGIPIALKDNISVAGMETRNGSKFQHKTVGDAKVVATLRSAGAILIGKSNMDECAIGGTTKNPHFGPTANPWKPNLVPGGSSGGSGSAVASGLAWAALGTDTLGSVRLPAAYCGIVGFKATHDLISMDGIVPLSRTLDHVGPLSRSVRDVRSLLEILATPGSPDWSGISSEHSLSGSKIGILESIPSLKYDNVIINSFHQSIEDLNRAGAEIVILPFPDLDLNELRHSAFLLIESECSEFLSEPVHDHPEAFSTNLKLMLEYGRNLSTNKLNGIRAKLNQAKTAILNLFEGVDFVATPTTPQLAFPWTEPAPVNQAEITGLANISGVPAISLPSGIAPSGLPLSFQLMGRPYREGDLLNAAEDLERIWGRPSLPIL